MERFLDPGTLSILIPILAVVGVFTFLILQQRAKHKERMAMIEQGMHPDRPELADPEHDPDHEPELIER